jgi:ABC-type antimicrobial peptide transport system ATPase subunit
MNDELKELVRNLKKENAERTIVMNNGNISDYGYTSNVYTYNNTLDIIKRIEAIIGKVS